MHFWDWFNYIRFLTLLYGWPAIAVVLIWGARYLHRAVGRSAILPVLLLIFGGFCNWSVVVANHGRMPVLADGYYYLGTDFFEYEHPRYCLLTPATKLGFLADRFSFSIGKYDAACSIGDMILGIGVMTIVYLLLAHFFRDAVNAVRHGKSHWP